jgi:concentrative nucleoside transporter, CNT family
MNYRLLSACGFLFMLGLAWLFSNNKKKIDLRVVVGGLSIQFFLALFVLHTDLGVSIFSSLSKVVVSFVELSAEGSRFVFGEKYLNDFAFRVLPTIIFVSSLSYILFYLGIIQFIVKGLSLVMVKVMNISGSESLVTAANIFLGQTEAPLFIKPYLKNMTRSEIMTMMTGGMATVAGGVLAAYIGLGIPAQHILAASVIAAPAAVVIAKIMFPETSVSETKGKVEVNFKLKEVNLAEAACSGASAGLQLALNVGAMLITFIALIALCNKCLGFFDPWVSPVLGMTLSLENILGTIFRPIAFLMGISWSESLLVGRLLGEKLVLNEFIAYAHLFEYMKEGALSERAINITTYALCGFANFSSIAIQVGGIGSLEPTRKVDFAKCGFRALVAATLTGFLTACLAGVLV